MTNKLQVDYYRLSAKSESDRAKLCRSGGRAADGDCVEESNYGTKVFEKGEVTSRR